MPLTNKEKMARRRAKIASDPVKREEYLKSERERKKKEREMLRKSMSPRQVKKFNVKESARVMAIYKKKQAKTTGTNTFISLAEELPKLPYKNKCSFKKAVYRASRNLPTSPRKKKLLSRH